MAYLNEKVGALSETAPLPAKFADAGSANIITLVRESLSYWKPGFVSNVLRTYIGILFAITTPAKILRLLPGYRKNLLNRILDPVRTAVRIPLGAPICTVVKF